MLVFLSAFFITCLSAYLIGIAVDGIVKTFNF